MRTAPRTVSHPLVLTAALPASTVPLIGGFHSQLSFRPVRLACLMAATNGVAANGNAVLEKAVEHLSLQQDTSPLFQPIQVGRHQLSTRLCYCPLTRMRAVIGRSKQIRRAAPIPLIPGLCIASYTPRKVASSCLEFIAFPSPPADNQIQPRAAEYYSQRTEAGVLLITEATVVEPRGLG